MTKIMENGRYYSFISWEQREEAERNGIDYPNLLNRVNNLGWEVERAITEPIRKRPTKREKYGQEVIDNLKNNNIKYHTFISRVRSGWDVLEASKQPFISQKERGKRMMKTYMEKGYKGGLKAEHFKVAENNGICRLTLYNRVNTLNWSIERAITEPPNREKSGYYTRLRNKQLKQMQEKDKFKG